jgi:hypothetical protein
MFEKTNTVQHGNPGAGLYSIAACFINSFFFSKKKPASSPSRKEKKRKEKKRKYSACSAS